MKTSKNRWCRSAPLFNYSGANLHQNISTHWLYATKKWCTLVQICTKIHRFFNGV